MRSEGVQTETGNFSYFFLPGNMSSQDQNYRISEAENDSCDAVFSQNVSVCTNVQDLALSEFSPMPQVLF